MGPLEKTITNSVIAEAKRRGWWAKKIHGSAFQSGLPDVLCIKHGAAVWLEVKRPGQRPTPHQEATMAEISRVGGALCYVVTSRQEAAERLSNAEEATASASVVASLRGRSRPAGDANGVNDDDKVGRIANAGRRV